TSAPFTPALPCKRPWRLSARSFLYVLVLTPFSATALDLVSSTRLNAAWGRARCRSIQKIINVSSREPSCSSKAKIPSWWINSLLACRKLPQIYVSKKRRGCEIKCVRSAKLERNSESRCHWATTKTSLLSTARVGSLRYRCYSYAPGNWLVIKSTALRTTSSLTKRCLENS